MYLARHVRLHFCRFAAGHIASLSGVRSKARAGKIKQPPQYRKFLDYWGSGNREIKGTGDAQARLVGLQTRT